MSQTSISIAHDRSDMMYVLRFDENVWAHYIISPFCWHGFYMMIGVEEIFVWRLRVITNQFILYISYKLMHDDLVDLSFGNKSIFKYTKLNQWISIEFRKHLYNIERKNGLNIMILTNFIEFCSSRYGILNLSLNCCFAKIDILTAHMT